MFVIAIFVGALRFPGDSGYVNIPTSLGYTTPSIHGMYYRDLLLYEGQIFDGELTHYCWCPLCWRQWYEGGRKANGDEVRELTPDCRTVAANWLPFDTIVEVNGEQYRVTNRGGWEFDIPGRLDIFVYEGHEEALRRGRIRDIEVRVVSLP